MQTTTTPREQGHADPRLPHPLAGALRTALGDPSERLVREAFGVAGIEIDGPAPHDIQVHDKRFFARVLRDGELGMGESYMDGWWDAEAVDETITRTLLGGLKEHFRQSWVRLASLLRARLLNLQGPTRAFEIGERHYDAGNDLYEAMLDRRMVYTCAYWHDAKTLDEAQEAKLDLVCRKVGLKPGMRVLELGCGWGSFAGFAAERYGVHVTGYTVSKEQVALGRARNAGLPVEIHLADYRDATGTFDAVVSIGLMEHVGPKNYRTYMKVVDRCLAPGGVSFMHTIAGNRSVRAIDPWFDRYIFPNAVLPSAAQLTDAMEGRFVLEDLHNFGPDYDRTCMAWHERFEAAWPALAPRYDQRFYRMWRYYLLGSAAAFRSRTTQLFQVVMTRPGTPQPRCRLT